MTNEQLGNVALEELATLEIEIKKDQSALKNAFVTINSMQLAIESREAIIEGNDSIDDLSLTFSNESLNILVHELDIDNSYIEPIVANESLSNMENLQLSTEGFIKVLKKIWETIKLVIKKLIRVIKKAFIKFLIFINTIGSRSKKLKKILSKKKSRGYLEISDKNALRKKYSGVCATIGIKENGTLTPDIVGFLLMDNVTSIYNIFNTVQMVTGIKLLNISSSPEDQIESAVATIGPTIETFVNQHRESNKCIYKNFDVDVDNIPILYGYTDTGIKSILCDVTAYQEDKSLTGLNGITFKKSTLDTSMDYSELKIPIPPKESLDGILDSLITISKDSKKYVTKVDKLMSMVNKSYDRKLDYTGISSKFQRFIGNTANIEREILLDTLVDSLFVYLDGMKKTYTYTNIMVDAYTGDI